MAYQLIILKAAADDTKEAYKYYEEIQPGLGDRFLYELVIRLMRSANIHNIMVL